MKERLQNGLAVNCGRAGKVPARGRGHQEKPRASRGFPYGRKRLSLSPLSHGLTIGDAAGLSPAMTAERTV